MKGMRGRKLLDGLVLLIAAAGAAWVMTGDLVVGAAGAFVFGLLVGFGPRGRLFDYRAPAAWANARLWARRAEPLQAVVLGALWGFWIAGTLLVAGQGRALAAAATVAAFSLGGGVGWALAPLSRAHATPLDRSESVGALICRMLLGMLVFAGFWLLIPAALGGDDRDVVGFMVGGAVFGATFTIATRRSTLAVRRALFVAGHASLFFPFACAARIPMAALALTLPCLLLAVWFLWSASPLESPDAWQRRRRATIERWRDAENAPVN